MSDVNPKRSLKCPICMEKLEDLPQNIGHNCPETPVAKPCGHVFHRACLNKSITAARHGMGLRKVCPICKRPTPSQYNVRLNFRSQMEYVQAERARRAQAEEQAILEQQQTVDPEALAGGDDGEEVANLLIDEDQADVPPQAPTPQREDGEPSAKVPRMMNGNDNNNNGPQQ